MVVTFDNTERNAKLSLRQSEILAKLQKIVDDIACGCDKCVHHLIDCDLLSEIACGHLASRYRRTTQSTDASCSSRRPVRHTQAA